ASSSISPRRGRPLRPGPAGRRLQGSQRPSAAHHRPAARAA
ncbi:MAG: hypothetical protein AVDCRST_MAG89-3327, partial [uncultured Gemmatimonadetes bacterium]